LTQITFEAAGKLIIVGRNLVGKQLAAETHASGESGTGGGGADVSVRTIRIRSSRGGVIRDCEWIERILNRHADARRADSAGPVSIGKDIRRKWSRRQGAVPETAHVLEVAKELQIFAANFVVERAVEVFTVHWGH